MAASDPLAATRRLSAPIRAFYASPLRTFSQGPSPAAPYTVDSIKTAVGAILQSVREHSPLVHQVTLSACSPLRGG